MPQRLRSHTCGDIMHYITTDVSLTCFERNQEIFNELSLPYTVTMLVKLKVIRICSRCDTCHVLFLILLQQNVSLLGTVARTVVIRESPPQFENRIKARVYVRSITHSTIYQKAPFYSQNWRMEISSVACGFSSINMINIDYSEYPKSLISRINEVYVFIQQNIAIAIFY